jgi:hypothetical protein
MSDIFVNLIFQISLLKFLGFKNKLKANLIDYFSFREKINDHF